MVFCQKNSVHLISDEVYALSVYGTDYDDEKSLKFSSVLSIDCKGLIDPDRLHVFYGMSKVSTVLSKLQVSMLSSYLQKDFGAAGLRLGCLVTQNALLRKAVACNMRFHNPSGMSIAIATQLLEDRDFVRSFIKTSHERLRAAREYTAQVFDDAGIKYHRGR